MTSKENRALQLLKWRIEWFCKNKANAFSPTISPAPKSLERNEIESCFEALKYYFSRNVSEFVIQKKYMGSYCDIYLCKNIEDSYLISRNGHKIDHIDLITAIKELKKLYERFDWTSLSLVIIQAELLPWSLLGKGLISGEFQGYLNAHQNHLKHLEHSNLYTKINEVKNSESFLTYIKDKTKMNPFQFNKKYVNHVRRQYDSIADFKTLDISSYKEGISTFESQINYYGKEDVLNFKPFNILKKIMDDGSEIIVNDNLSFKEVNDHKCLHFSINNLEELEARSLEVKEWFDQLANENEEGIVIKPRQSFIKGLPPAFKVRNNKYLVMIYGVNFLNDFKRQLSKRNIGKKIECSINDWKINHEILKVKYNEINTENYHLKNLLHDRIMGETIAAKLDSRL
jgi:hypothetical protein